MAICALIALFRGLIPHEKFILHDSIFSASVQLTISFLSRFLATVCAGVCMLFGFLLYNGCAAGFHKVTRMHTGTALDRGGQK